MKAQVVICLLFIGLLVAGSFVGTKIDPPRHAVCNPCRKMEKDWIMNKMTYNPKEVKK